MSGTDLMTAMEAAVARMERNRLGNPLADYKPPRPVVELPLHPTTGAALLPAAPRLMTPCADLGPALSAARAAGSNCYAMVAPAPAREAAQSYAAFLEQLLNPVADQDLIREWLSRWAVRCRRQNGDDYGEFERDVIFTLEDVPAIAFCTETAKLAAQEPRFVWLPQPREVHALLTAWLAPYTSTLEAARKVAVAQEPEPPAREAPEPPPVTEEEIAARRDAIAKTMTKHRLAMDAQREARICGSRPKPKPSTYSAYFHAVALRNTLAGGGCESQHRPAMKVRLAGLLRTNPDLAEEIGVSADDVEAGALGGAFA